MKVNTNRIRETAKVNTQKLVVVTKKVNGLMVYIKKVVICFDKFV